MNFFFYKNNIKDLIKRMKESKEFGLWKKEKKEQRKKKQTCWSRVNIKKKPTRRPNQCLKFPNFVHCFGTSQITFWTPHFLNSI